MDRRLPAPPDQIHDGIFIVDHRFGVRHADHGSVAAGRCRPGPCLHILFVSEARIPEVDMSVHQPRCDTEASAVDDLQHLSLRLCNEPRVQLQLLSDLDDLSFRDQDIPYSVCPGRGVQKTDLSQHNHTSFSPILNCSPGVPLPKMRSRYSSAQGRPLIRSITEGSPKRCMGKMFRAPTAFIYSSRPIQ